MLLHWYYLHSLYRPLNLRVAAKLRMLLFAHARIGNGPSFCGVANLCKDVRNTSHHLYPNVPHNVNNMFHMAICSYMVSNYGLITQTPHAKKIAMRLAAFFHPPSLPSSPSLVIYVSVTMRIVVSNSMNLHSVCFEYFCLSLFFCFDTLFSFLLFSLCYHPFHAPAMSPMISPTQA